MSDTSFAEPLSSGVYRRTADRGDWPEAPVPQPPDLERAAAEVRRAWGATPLVMSVPLSRKFDRRVYLKLENLAPVRSFKFRGALASVAAIAAERPGAAIFTASTGNHGQGMAFAATRLGISVTVCSPANALVEKLEAMASLGARVLIEGDNLTAAQAAAQQMARDADGVYVEDGEDPQLMAGAATVAWEVMESDASPATLIVPVGGGNLIAGSLLAKEHVGADTAIVGVQSTAAQGATVSWLSGRVVSRSCATFAGGLATEFPGALSWEVMDRWLQTMVLVDELDLYQGVAKAFRETGLVFEGAAAATMAALSIHGREVPGDSVALLVTGSWLSPAELSKALAS